MSIKYRVIKGKLERRRSKAAKWKTLKEFPRYQVSNTGKVRLGKTDKRLTVTNGTVVLRWPNKKHTRRSVAKLMESVGFHVPRPLTPYKVTCLKRRIRKLQKVYDSGVPRGTWNSLAKEFGISRIMLWYIRTGKKWKGIK